MKKYIKVIIQAIFAGASIAFAGLLFVLSKAYLPASTGLLLGSALFPIGLLIICFLGFYLYTGKIGLVFRHPEVNKSGINSAIWLLLIYVGNFLGVLVIGEIVYGLSLIPGLEQLKTCMLTVATSKAIYSFKDYILIFINSLFCGALVYIAVYNFKHGSNFVAKFIGIFVPVMLFVHCGFQHCIANMFYLLAANVWNLESLISILLCTVGNSLGSILIDLLMDY